MKNQFKLRWTDDKHIDRYKVYDDYETAQKALKWLTERGIDNADIALIRIVQPKPDIIET